MPANYPDGPRLLADIGAVHARFALETAPGRIGDLATLPCAHYRRFEDAAIDYLASMAQRQRGCLRHAVVVIVSPGGPANAGHASAGRAHHWSASLAGARSALRLDTLLVLSDTDGDAAGVAASASIAPHDRAGMIWLLTPSLPVLPALRRAAALLTAALSRAAPLAAPALAGERARHGSRHA